MGVIAGLDPLAALLAAQQQQIAQSQVAQDGVTTAQPLSVQQLVTTNLQLQSEVSLLKEQLTFTQQQVQSLTNEKMALAMQLSAQIQIATAATEERKRVEGSRDVWSTHAS